MDAYVSKHSVKLAHEGKIKHVLVQAAELLICLTHKGQTFKGSSVGCREVLQWNLLLYTAPGWYFYTLLLPQRIKVLETGMIIGETASHIAPFSPISAAAQTNE
jgi:hypothetical protein